MQLSIWMKIPLPIITKNNCRKPQYTLQVIRACLWTQRPQQFNTGKAESFIHLLTKRPQLERKKKPDKQVVTIKLHPASEGSHFDSLGETDPLSLYPERGTHFPNGTLSCATESAEQSVPVMSWHFVKAINREWPNSVWGSITSPGLKICVSVFTVLTHVHLKPIQKKGRKLWQLIAIQIFSHLQGTSLFKTCKSSQ